MVEWLAAQGHEVRVITAPPYYPQWQVARLFRLAVQSGGGPPVWRCPLYVPKQLSTLKRLLHLGGFCGQQFFPADGATSLEAGAHYPSANAVCTPGMRLLAELLGARTVLRIGVRSKKRHAGAGPCRKRQRRRSGAAGDGVRT
ncbi:hypothetical protein ACNKHU_12480 [Shigella flexneri]